MKYCLLIVCLFSLLSAYAQPAKEIQAIKNLCGCYEVDFIYTETFAPDRAYQFHKPYHVGGLEYITLAEVSPKKMVIQHLLVADDSIITKHWREDWEYEKRDLWLFNHDAAWRHVTATGNKGEWTQTVWEVDDAPRYQGSSKWISNNNKYYWENTTDAPLPRREYTKRKDYNVLQRNNRIVFTDSGWVHEQDNNKIIRTDGSKDVLLAQEKGYNTYVKTADSKCAAAAAWWTKNKDFWATIRQIWADEMRDKNEIRLVNEVNGEKLYEQLDTLQAQALSVNELKAKAKEILGKFIQHTGGNTAAVQSNSK